MTITRMNFTAYSDLFERYIEDASFLWSLRALAIKQPHYTKPDFKELEQRIDGFVNVLMTAQDLSWSLCEKAIELEGSGEMFIATLIAFHSGDLVRIKKVLDIGVNNQNCFLGLVSALAWLPDGKTHSFVKKLLLSKNSKHQHLGVTACRIRREDPEKYLHNILKQESTKSDEALYSECMRTIGELKIKNLMIFLSEGSESDIDSVAFWATWSRVIMGDLTVLDKLGVFALSDGPFQSSAIELIVRAAPMTKAKKFISTLSEGGNNRRQVIKATMALGEPLTIRWLIEKMKDTQLAKLAGEAFTTITGFDLEQNGLLMNKTDTKDEETIIPDNDDLDIDEDEYLNHPDPEKVKLFWQQKVNDFEGGCRYFIGKKIDINSLKQQLSLGLQRQRARAALELALLNQANPYINIKARRS